MNVKKGEVFERTGFNSGLDSRSMFEDRYDDFIYNYLDSDSDIDLDYGKMYELIELDCDDFETRIEDYGIELSFKYKGYTGGIFGGLYQNDPFDIDIEIYDDKIFNKGYNEFLDYLKTNPKEHYFDGSFNPYIDYNGTMIIYDINDTVDMYFEYISKHDFDIEDCSDYIESIHIADDAYKAIEKYINSQ